MGRETFCTTWDVGGLSFVCEALRVYEIRAGL